MTEKPPEGYLFICATGELRFGQCSVGWPDCPAYWSLDISGSERLSREDATGRGFPGIEFTMEVFGCSWGEAVYAGLRTFHQGKGFDPDSLDLAHHLGYPILQTSSRLNPPFAHGKVT
jgi:hypothetical protein